MNLEIHHLNLLQDVGIAWIELSEPTQVGDSLLAARFSPQPPGRLSQKQKAADKDETRRYKLYSERNEPLAATERIALGHAKVDPEPYEAPYLPAELVGTHQATTDGRRSNL